MTVLMDASVGVDGTETPSSSDAERDPAGGTETDGRPGVPARGSGPSIGTVIGGLAGLWGLLIGLGRLYDNSFMTHLATGRLILDRGGVPRVDPYSFTAQGDPWVVQSWLASAIYAGAEELGGLGGVRLVNGLLCGLLGLAVWRLTARSQSFLVRLAVTSAVLVPATALWSGRPLLFGLGGLAAILLVADERLDPRWLVPIGWVWVNTHGSFPFAIVLLGLLAVGTRLDRGAWGPEVRALKWAAAGIAVGAINPLGPKLLLFPATLGSRTEAFKAVAEWQPPQYEALVDYWVLGLLLVGVLGLVHAPRWRAALPLVVFGGLALTSARNLGPLTLVLAPVLAGAVPRLGIDVESVRRPTFRVALVGVAALAVVSSVVALNQPHLAVDDYPVDAVAWMEDEGLWGPTSRVIAPDYVGNYRELLRGDEARVFLDDRVDMYPLSAIQDYGDLLHLRGNWEEVLERREATAVLWSTDKPLGRALARSDAWRVVHRDAPWVVAVPAS